MKWAKRRIAISVFVLSSTMQLYLRYYCTSSYIFIVITTTHYSFITHSFWYAPDDAIDLPARIRLLLRRRFTDIRNPTTIRNYRSKMDISNKGKRVNVISQIRKEMKDLKKLQRDIRRDVIRQSNTPSFDILFKNKRPARPSQKLRVRTKTKPPAISRRRHTYDSSTSKKIQTSSMTEKPAERQTRSSFDKKSGRNKVHMMKRVLNMNKKPAWNNITKVKGEKKAVVSADCPAKVKSGAPDVETKASTNTEICYHRLRICSKWKFTTHEARTKISKFSEQVDMHIATKLKQEEQVNSPFRSSYTFLSLPDPSKCANELACAQKAKEEADAYPSRNISSSPMKRSYSSPSRVMQTVWRHGIMVGLTKNKDEKQKVKHHYRRLPSKGKLLMRMTASASAFRKWKCEMWRTRQDELKFISRIQMCFRRYSFNRKVHYRHANKILKRNLYLARLFVRCKQRTVNAKIIRNFCVQASEQGKFNILIKKYRWNVITCQRWCKQWISAKRERLKILGRLFDARVKNEFKKGRLKFDKYIDQMVKTSDVRTAMKEVADIREQWAKKHMLVNMVLKKRRNSKKIFRTKKEILAHIPTFDSAVETTHGETDEGIKLRKSG